MSVIWEVVGVLCGRPLALRRGSGRTDWGLVGPWMGIRIGGLGVRVGWGLWDDGDWRTGDERWFVGLVGQCVNSGGAVRNGVFRLYS